MADILRMLQEQNLGPESGLWETPRPEPQPMVPTGGANVDIARALMAALQQMPPTTRRQGAGAAFLRGAAGGFGAATLGRENTKQATNEERAKANEKAEESWRTGAREMSRRRWELQREAMKPQKEPEALDRPIPEGLRAELKVPKTIVTYRDLNELQQRDTNRRIADERSTAAGDRAAAAETKAADEDAQVEAMAQGVVDKSVDPRTVKPQGRQTAVMLRVQNRVNELLRERGERRTLRELQQLREEADRFSKAGNSQRFQQLRASAGAAAEHTKQFDEAYKRWNQRAKGAARIAVANLGLFRAAQQGFLGQGAQAEAAALVPVREALINEIPVVLAGGFAPQEKQYAEAQKMLTDMFGPGGQAARMGSIRRVLKTRLDMFEKSVPFMGGRTVKDNPYLLDVSPLYGWEEGEKRVIVQPDDGASGATWKPKTAKEVPE